MRAVDVDATRSGGVVVETGGDEDASTCAEASWISKMVTKATAKRTTVPTPILAMMMVFIFFV
jgi:hypothetical protein